MGVPHDLLSAILKRSTVRRMSEGYYPLNLCCKRLLTILRTNLGVHEGQGVDQCVDEGVRGVQR